jgi:hypothetical protein
MSSSNLVTGNDRRLLIEGSSNQLAELERVLLTVGRDRVLRLSLNYLVSSPEMVRVHSPGRSRQWKNLPLM